MSSANIVPSANAQNRFGSFSGTRDNILVNFYVDGEEYFAAVAEALEGAREYIYIADWWMSPQVHLRRPHAGDKYWRLDEVLKRKASQGVKIYIVLYKEFKLALSNNSRYVKTWMQNLHENVKVQRHPDHEGDNSVLFWAHHEKIVVVDSKIGFCGGLDLCFGRFDNHGHRLADPTEIMWSGQDYNNPRRKDFFNVDEYKKTLIDRQVFPRMPWHDVSLRVTGMAAYDLARHFCERWNFVKNTKNSDQVQLPLIDPGKANAEAYSRQVRGTCRVQVLRSSSQWSSGIPTEHSIMNAYIELIEKSQHFIYIENQFFISNPTNKDDYDIKNKIANALVQRIVRAFKEKKPFRVIVAMPLMPAFEADIDDKGASTLRLVMHWQYRTISRGGASIFEQLVSSGIRPSDYISFFGLRQWDLLRAKKWYPQPSKEEVAKMNHNEQDDLKFEQKQRHNQMNDYLPSWLTNFVGDLFKNEIEVQQATGSAKAEALDDLEKDSLYVNELVYIHTKLMIVDDRYIICGSANLNDRSMCGDRDSEIAVCVEDMETVDSRMNGRPYQAARTAINLRGKIFQEHLGLLPETNMRRLSHMAPHLKPPALKPTDPYSMKVMDMLSDPLSKQFWELWTGVATKNTEIYRNLFHCVPDDTIKSWADYKKFYPNKEIVLPGHVVNVNLEKKEIQKELDKVQGHLVEFPTAFLVNEELKATKWSAESVMPEDVFT